MQRWAILLCCFTFWIVFGRPGEVDESFRPGLPAHHIVTAVFEQEDGKLLVGGSVSPVTWDEVAFLVRLKPDGKVDESFHVRWGKPGVDSDAWGISQIQVRPNGDIGVLGWDFSLIRGTPLNGAAVFTRNGTLRKWYGTEEIPRGGSFFPDGSILYPSTTNFWFTLPGVYAQLRQLDPNGNVAWSSGAIAPPSPVKGKSNLFAWCRALPDGTMVGGLMNVVETWYRPWQPVQDYRNTRYYLYSSAWGQMQINIGSGGPIDARKAYAVVAPGPTNSLYLAGGPHLGILTRRLAGWQIDPSFNFQSPETNGTIRAMAVQPDGKVVYCFIAGGTNQLYRCNTDGSHDLTFGFGAQADASVQSLLVLRSGRILAWGSYMDADGIRRQTFVRLNTE
jgi:hypothetical protein